MKVVTDTAIALLSTLVICFSPQGAKAETLYGTSFNSQRMDLLVQIDPTNGFISSPLGLSAGGGSYGFATNIAVAPDGGLYGTSLNAQGIDLLVQIDPANGNVLSSIGISDGDFWPLATSIAFAPEPNVSAVPEPSTWAMMILGFVGIGFMAYRRKAMPASLAA
jgi:hypothetical protein